MNCVYCHAETKTSDNYTYCTKCGKPFDEKNVVTLSDNVTRKLPLYNSPTETNIDSNDVLKFCTILALFLGMTIALLQVFLQPFTNPDKSPVDPNKDTTLYFIQAIMAIVFILFSCFTPIGTSNEDETSMDSTANKSFQQFLKGWITVWTTWTLLYLYLGIALKIAASYPAYINNPIIQATVDFLNACTSTAFLYMFLVSDMESVPTKKNKDRNKSFRKGFITIIIISVIIIIFAIVGRFSEQLTEFSVYASGSFAAISMLYVFGRFDSHHMNVNRWLLAPLYLYGIIQFVGPKLLDFSTNNPYESYQWVFFMAALILKIYLFLVITIWIKDGAFNRYFNDASKYIENKNSPKKTNLHF